MTTRRPLATSAAIFLAPTACASVDVRTLTSPDANLSALRTFRIMQHAKAQSPSPSSTNDPMLVNSISNRALRADLIKGFENRGYALSDTPDFTVAYYASTKDKLDVTYWDYGYPYYPRWWGFGPYEQPTVTEYTQGTVIVATSVYFGFDSSELSAQARDTLQAFFDLAQQRPDQNLRIEGNCDERGTREYNLALGQRRADAAKTYLLNLGLEPSRITTISYGEERPRAPGHDKAAWRQNRRDDLMAVTAAVSEAR